MIPPIRMGFTAQVAASTRAVTGLRDKVDRNAQVAISGLQVQRVSDAAGQWSQVQHLEDRLRDQGVYTKNAQSALSTLSVAENALAQGTNLLTEARTLAVQMASETYNDDDRAGMVARVRGIRQELIGLANVEIGGRHVFAGTSTDLDAYDQTGVYQGDLNVSRTVVGDGQEVQTTFAGDLIFDDALATLNALAAALDSGFGSADATAAQLENLDFARENLVRTRQEVGFQALAADDAATLADSLELSLQQAVNDHLAADPVEALTAFSESQSAYEVALQVTAQVNSQTLFDYLR